MLGQQFRQFPPQLAEGFAMMAPTSSGARRCMSSMMTPIMIALVRLDIAELRARQDRAAEAGAGKIGVGQVGALEGRRSGRSWSGWRG